MSDDKNPLEHAVDQAMDTFVYAPIGLFFDGPALFPKLVEKGRNQVKVARVMGQMAVQMGQTEATKRVGKAQRQARESLAAAGLVATHTPPDAPETAATATTSAPPAAKAPTAPKKKASAATKKKAARRPAKKAAKAASAPSATSLGIPDYDSLSASQVVSRLRGLAPKDLDALRAYESATRARKTILNKITQLQKS